VPGSVLSRLRRYDPSCKKRAMDSGQDSSQLVANSGFSSRFEKRGSEEL